MSPADLLAQRRRDIAQRHADAAAQEARELILGMRDNHANLVLVLDAIHAAISDADWGDFSATLDRLTEAQEQLDDVYSIRVAA